MPRSDQPIRQWRILKFIEANGRATLQRLASELEEVWHERTIRRDLEALSLAGFPVYDQREDGRTVWALDDDFRRFPIPLTATEILSLQCGRDLLKPLDGTFLGDSLHNLLQKARSVLTPKAREYLSLLQQSLSIGPMPHKVYRAQRISIERIREAIEGCRTIEMKYLSLRSSRPAKRYLNPYALWYQNGGLYLVGYDHIRKAERTFAVDRIRSLHPNDRVFQAPLYFSVQGYFKDAFGVFRGKPEAVELVFERQAARWVRERQWHHSQRIVPMKGGRIRRNLQVAVSAEMLAWVMGFGSQVRVVRPDHLAKAVQGEAWSLLGKYQGTRSGRSSLTRRGRDQPGDFSISRVRKLS